MSLEEELNLPKPLKDINHETLLNIFRTSSLLSRYSDNFFSKHNITDIQFNILVTLKEYSPIEGINQNELSKMLIVSKSNIVGLIDRLEKAEYVERKVPENDRRVNKIFVTKKGLKLIEKLHDGYFNEVNNIIGCLTNQEKKYVISAMEKIRKYINNKI